MRATSLLMAAVLSVSVGPASATNWKIPNRPHEVDCHALCQYGFNKCKAGIVSARDYCCTPKQQDELAEKCMPSLKKCLQYCPAKDVPDAWQ